MPSFFCCRYADFREERTIIGTKYKFTAILKRRIRDPKTEDILFRRTIFPERSKVRHRIKETLIRTAYPKNEPRYAIESDITHFV